MSYKVGGAVAAVATALALSTVAYGDTGKSPNGPPGPAGNPNQPAATPQADGPQGPAGSQAQGKRQSAKAHGKSNASHGKSNASHGKSQAQSHSNHANPKPGTPRKGGREDRPAGKITICHATRSNTNPYVEITISVNGLHGHGPADDSRHHEGSWKDIIPAPEGGCPTTVPTSTSEQPTAQTTTTTPIAPPTPEVAVVAPASEAAAQPQQVVLGEHVSGGDEPQSKVLGASASGDTPKAALAARKLDDRSGSLPFTGYALIVVLLAAAAALLGGFALRRATARGRS
jgi:hypothetical protein